MATRRTFVLGVTLGLALVVCAAPVGAEPGRDSPTEEGGGDRPWAKGVSEQQQKVALELFQQGNAAIKESLFVQAAEKYRAALEHWDHPAIHYNLALALLNLDQPIQVHQHLDHALRYGEAPLEKEKFEHAKSYKELIEKQLARVEIRCDTDGATVLLDGATLFEGPGTHRGVVRAGRHTLVAKKAGYLTTEKTMIFPPGERTDVRLHLFTDKDLVEHRRHWDTWKPWAVVGAGVVLAGGGALLHWQASEKFAQYDAAVRDCDTPVMGGCPASEGLNGMKDRGERNQTLAFVAYGVGGAAVVAGAVLVYVNRELPYRVSLEERERRLGVSRGERRVSVAPVIGPDGGGVVAAFQF